MTISFSGLASGLDTSSWITSLTALKQAKITTLQQQRETIATSKDTLQSIKSFFSSFRATIEKITDSRFNIATMNLFAQTIAKSADVSVFTASATSEAKEGKYEIKVDKLASTTRAESQYKTTTTLIETTTATLSSKLSALGVGVGNIKVTTDTGVHTVSIVANDTLSSFASKLQNIGVSAFYNESTGIFSADIGAGAIDDVGHTNIVSKLHLQDATGLSTDKLVYTKENQKAMNTVSHWMRTILLVIWFRL